MQDIDQNSTISAANIGMQFKQSPYRDVQRELERRNQQDLDLPDDLSQEEIMATIDPSATAAALRERGSLSMNTLVREESNQLSIAAKMKSTNV